jgi:hypothetical protein
MKQFVYMVSLDFFEAHERGDVEGEGSVYSDQQTGAIGAKPAVKIQSPSAPPGIATCTTFSCSSSHEI